MKDAPGASQSGSRAAHVRRGGVVAPETAPPGDGLGPLPVEMVGLPGRVSDRAMRGFKNRRRRARRRSKAWRDRVRPNLEMVTSSVETNAREETAADSRSKPIQDRRAVQDAVQTEWVVHDKTDTSGAVYVRGMIGGTQQTAVISPEDLEDAPFQGSPGLRWLLTNKLVREFERTSARRYPPGSSVEYVDGTGRKLPVASWPEDLEQLAELARQGITCIMRVRLRGGMDGAAPADAHVSFGPELDWTAVEAELTALTTGKPSPTGNARHYGAARQLHAIYRPERWGAFPPPTSIRGLCTPARLLALGAVIERRRMELTDCSLDSWIHTGEGVDVRINDLRAAALGTVGASMDEVQTQLAAAVATIPGMDTSVHYDVGSLRKSIRVDGNLSRTDSVGSATLIIAQGPWVGELLRGTRELVPGSYVTLAACGSMTEVLLDPNTSGVLKAIKAGLDLDSRTFRRLIEGALKRAFATTMCLVRITNSHASTAGDGGGKSKPKREFYHPDSASSRIAFSIDAGSLLSVYRNHTHIPLHLGLPGEFPVVLSVVTPPCPRPTLYDLLRPVDSTLFRYRPPRTPATGSRLFVIGFTDVETEINDRTTFQLPGGWLTSRSGSDRERKSRMCTAIGDLLRRELGAVHAVLVGRNASKTGGGDPLLLYIEFGADGPASALETMLDIDRFPDMLTAGFNVMLPPGQQRHLFATNAPAEALDLLNEKDLAQQLRSAYTAPAPPPPPPPPPRDASGAAH